MALALIAATVLSYAVGLLAGSPVLVPILNTVASYPFMVLALKHGDLRLAVARMLLWALTMGVCAMLLSYARPAATATLFLRADAYRAEMFEWVLTGRGAESSPSRFIPQQFGQAAVFCGLALATAGLLAMPMGAVLMNYMGHYVGTLASRSASPALTMLLAWHPWSVVRIVSFVTLGVVLSIPMLSRVMHAKLDRRTSTRFIVLACAGLALDILMKALLAPAWQRLLLRTVGSALLVSE
jgi:hypothetical protein